MVNFFQCYDFLAHSHYVNLKKYSGNWILTDTVYDQELTDDSKLFITLKNDSTFLSNCLIIWEYDTSSSKTVKGKWYPWHTGTGRDNYYNELVLTVNGIEKRWRIEGDASTGDCRWYTDHAGHEPEYYWTLKN